MALFCLWLAILLLSPPKHTCSDALQTMRQWEHSEISVAGFEGAISMWQTGTEHKDTVILVHGLGQNGSTDWRNVIPVLSSRYRVIAFDLPGFGCSKNVRGDFTPRAYARVIRHVVATLATGKVALVGHSMGAAVALRYGADYPGTLSQLVLVDAAGILVRTAYVKEVADIPLDTQTGSQWWRRSKAFIEELSTALIEWVNLAPDPVDIVRSIRNHLSESHLDASQAAVALELLDEDFSKIVPKVALPTHIIWGADDPVAPLRTAKVLHRRITGSTLDIIEDAGHVPMASHPTEFNALLLERLGGSVQAQKPASVTGTSKGDLRCVNEVGSHYSGRYDTITLQNCKAVTFENVTATQVTMRDSSAAFENLTVRNASVAFDAVHSVVLMTNTQLRGDVALRSEGSRIDMAGTTLKAATCTLEVRGKSRLIASLSNLASSSRSRSLHGDFRIRHSECFDEQ